MPSRPHSEIDQVIRVNDALVDLEQVDGHLVRAVEMRYVAVMSAQEIGECLGVSARTARGDWEKSHSLLSAAL